MMQCLAFGARIIIGKPGASSLAGQGIYQALYPFAYKLVAEYDVDQHHSAIVDKAGWDVSCLLVCDQLGFNMDLPQAELGVNKYYDMLMRFRKAGKDDNFSSIFSFQGGATLAYCSGVGSTAMARWQEWEDFTTVGDCRWLANKFSAYVQASRGTGIINFAFQDCAAQFTQFRMFCMKPSLFDISEIKASVSQLSVERWEHVYEGTRKLYDSMFLFIGASAMPFAAEAAAGVGDYRRAKQYAKWELVTRQQKYLHSDLSVMNWRVKLLLAMLRAWRK